MKIRTGFVSNSSSSSFILCGAFISDDKIKDQAKNLNIDVDEYVDNLYELKDVSVNYYEGHDGYLVGEMLVSGEDYLEDGEVDLNSIKNILPKIQKHFPFVQEEDIKIMFGTLGC